MSDLMTDSQQTNSRVFKSPLVSFSTVTGSGRFVSGMKQFRDANLTFVMKSLNKKLGLSTLQWFKSRQASTPVRWGWGRHITSCRKS
jgi:hypothetical protein